MSRRAKVIYGMARELWTSLGENAHDVPDAAEEAAEALADLYVQMNHVEDIVDVADMLDEHDDDREALGGWLASAALGRSRERWVADAVQVPRFSVVTEGDDLVWEGSDERVVFAANPGAPQMAYPCTVCGGHGPHEGAGHAYTTAIEKGGLMEHACTDCGGRGRHAGPGGHPYTTSPPKENPVGDHVDVVSGPGRGQRGVVRAETGRVAQVEFESGRRGHVERSALRTRSNPSEQYTARAQHSGATWTSPSVEGAMRKADDSQPAGEIEVRGEYTSDGTHWGPGRGRVVAVREGKRWQRI